MYFLREYSNLAYLSNPLRQVNQCMYWFLWLLLGSGYSGLLCVYRDSIRVVTSWSFLVHIKKWVGFTTRRCGMDIVDITSSFCPTIT
jgi:hypothetical protein